MRPILVAYVFAVVLLDVSLPGVHAGKKFKFQGSGKPQSDVPVTSDIGWWSHQECLSIEDLNIEVVEANLHLFNNEAHIRYRIKGSVAYSKGFWQPFIGKVHISERFTTDKEGWHAGDIQLTPIVNVKQNKNYAGEKIPFDIKVEKIVQTFGWMENRYLVRCGNITRDFKLMQHK